VLEAVRPSMSAAGDGLTEPNNYFLSLKRKKMQTSPFRCARGCETEEERRRRRLDGAEQLFSFAKAKENANESLPVCQRL